MKRFAAAIAACLIATQVQAWPSRGTGYIPQNYYVSATGSDGANGLTPATAWASPNHAVNCGDTLHMAAGAYSEFNFNTWGTVSNCPSTAKLYMARLQCDGPFVTSCNIASTVVNALWLNKSNWAVIGLSASSTTGSCFLGAPTSTANIHHIAFINVLAINCQAGGAVYTSYSSDPQYGVDYAAIVGAMAYNTVLATNLGFSPFSVYEPANVDAVAGTHIYAAGLIGWSNIEGGQHTDGELFTFDDFSGSQHATPVAYTGQGVVEQSLGFGNGGAGITVNLNSAAPLIVTQVTTWGNYQDTAYSLGNNGELQILTSSLITVTNNIFQATVASVNGHTVNGAIVANGDATISISGNYILGVGGNNTSIVTSPGFSYGSNTLATPDFTNPTVPGTPTCTASATTTACAAAMGIIANFTPRTIGAVGKGYIAPGACAPNANFPAWLAGILPTGLITQPCGTN